MPQLTSFIIATVYDLPDGPGAGAYTLFIAFMIVALTVGTIAMIRWGQHIQRERDKDREAWRGRGGPPQS